MRQLVLFQYSTNSSSNAVTLVAALSEAMAGFSLAYPFFLNNSVIGVDAGISNTLGYSTSQLPSGAAAALLDFNSETALLSFYAWYTASSYSATMSSLYTMVSRIQMLIPFVAYAPGMCCVFGYSVL